jgi:abortive infection bacteriophage resistance protein
MEKCLYFCNWIVPATLPAEQRTRAGRFILFPMRYAKQPTSITDQINLLKLRGLIIDDETEAKAVLERISYFRLASYWRPMEQDKVLHIFKPNSHFSNVTTLYRFDSELKSIVFNSIQRIEIAVRTRMIQQFSMKYGSFWFMDKKLFASEEIFQKNLNSLRYAVERSNEDFVVEHFQRYDEPDMPPAWKSLELATLGTLSRMYSNFIDNG